MRWIQTALAWFLVLFMSLVFVLLGVHDKFGGWLAFFFGLFLLVDRYLLAKYRVKRIFHKSPIVGSERTVVINTEGIRTILPNASEEVQWSAFRKARELKDVLLLYYGPHSYYIFPKRAFAGNDLESFRATLREKRLL